MDRHHGKPVDPRQFKQQTLENLEKKSRFHEKMSDRFVEEAENEVDVCPMCGSDARDTVFEQRGRPYVQCRDCSHVYQPRVLTEAQLVDFYEESSEYATTYTDPEQVDYRLEHITKPKMDFVRETIDIEQGRWLDVGCGIGTSIQYLESLGWDTVGLEISEDTVDAAAELLDISLTRQTLGEYLEDNPDAEFDVVTMFGYLDLVPDPMEDLARIADHLADDGWVAIHVPKFDSVSQYVQQAFPYQPFRYLTWNVLHAFTTESIDAAFDRSGFSLEAAWYYGLDVYELANALSLSVDGFQDSQLHTYLMDEFNEFQDVVDEHEMSDYMTAVGQKR
jgi:SAM-dependent methyltransferase